MFYSSESGQNFAFILSQKAQIFSTSSLSLQNLQVIFEKSLEIQTPFEISSNGSLEIKVNTLHKQ